MAEHPEGADENQNGACGHEHEGGRHVLDVDHDVAGDGHDGKSHRRADRDLAGAERGALHHGEDLDVEEEQEQVAEAGLLKLDHAPDRGADADQGGDGDGNEREALGERQNGVELDGGVGKRRRLGVVVLIHCGDR